MEMEKNTDKVENNTEPKSVNIYIVDDEQQQIELISDILDSTGFSAKGFTSGSSFIDQPVSSYDIVLLDLNMPNMDGIEIMRTLHNKGCNPAFILMSGFDRRVLHSARQFAEAKNIEVAGTHTKPINIAEFIKEFKYVHAKKELSVIKSLYHGTSLKRNINIELSATDIKSAIKNNFFTLHYQPQVEIKTGELRGFEALVRLQHPIHGLIYPNNFIGIAEDNNLISAITHEVFKLAINDIKRFEQLGITQKISINISAKDLDLEMPERLSNLLGSNNLSNSTIMIELTESTLQASVSDSLDILNRLRMKGFSLSIDDFGTGYSSLVQLYQAPFNELKIDLKFVMRMLKDKEAYAIVKMCILLAKELNLETVAEGVETQEILDELANLGCDIAQGYHIAKPMPFDDCCKWLTQHQRFC